MPNTPTRFRYSRAAMVLLPAVAALAGAALFAQTPASRDTAQPATDIADERAPYAPDPNHLWNRLNRTLFIDSVAPGPILHQSDPLLNAPEGYLLKEQPNRIAVALLDEFLASPQTQAAHPALDRIFLQHDLWAAFDDLAWRPDNWVHLEKDAPAAFALRTRLARAIQILALSDRELTNLPDNYAQAIQSARFANAFDPAQPDRPFLPKDLFDPHGPWVVVDHALDAQLAAVHDDGCGGRAVHAVLLSLPGGRAVTEEYLADLSPGDVKNFPAGTIAALVRRMLTIDQKGNPHPTPITESIQFRVFLEVPAVPSDDFPHKQQGGRQSFFEFILDRSKLSANDGLRSLGPDEPRSLFNRTVQARGEKQMSTCIECHNSSGIYSMHSMVQQLTGSPSFHTTFRASTWEQLTQRHIYAKTKQFQWGLLQGIQESTRQTETQSR